MTSRNFGLFLSITHFFPLLNYFIKGLTHILILKAKKSIHSPFIRRETLMKTVNYSQINKTILQNKKENHLLYVLFFEHEQMLSAIFLRVCNVFRSPQT